MGTMNKMRENTGIVLWILVISFGGLWVLQDSGVFDTIGADPLGRVIVVDGEVITRDEYSRQLESQLEQIRQSTGTTVEPQQLEVQRERAFNALVDNRLQEKEMDRLGITVSDTEVEALITGENPHPIIQAYFPGEDGGVNRALLQNVIDDPEQKETWIQLEDYIRLNRRQQKFNELITATVRVSEADIEAAYLQEAKNASAEFFFLRYADAPDDSVALSDRDIARFYQDHREDYRRDRLYSIAIASLSKLPAREDTLAFLREGERLRPGFEEAENDSVFLAQSGSERPYTDAFLGAGDIAKEIAGSLFDADQAVEVGRVVGPAVVNDEVHLVKIIGIRPAEETHVHARHVLVRASENDEDDLAAARAKIQEVRERIRQGEDFADLAREVSDDPGSGALGGDLGWFGDGTMVPAFQEAAFGARVGDLIGPVETQFGAHLIEVTRRADVEVQLATLALTLDASVATLTALEESLEDLKYYAEETGDFEGEAKRRDIALQSMDMQQDQVAVPGIGTSRALAKFLDGAATGDVSPIIEFNDVAIMVRVENIQPEGFRPLEEVEAQVRGRALLGKKMEYQQRRMARAYDEGGFDNLAGALGEASRTATDLSFSDPLAPGLGRDLIFAGTVLGLEEGQESGVINGKSGVFVARVIQQEEPSLVPESERERLRGELSSEKERFLRREWIAALREAANIEDLRTDFLQQ